MDRDSITVLDKQFVPFLRRPEIEQAVQRIAGQINKDYAGKQPMFIVVLKGAMVFAADVVRHIELPCTIETITAHSYGNQMESSGTVTLVNTLPDVQDKDVILVEDIIDTGLTLYTILEAMKTQKPASLNIACLLSKPTMHKVPLPLGYCCFEIPPAFVVGYGLDYAEQGRNLPEIYQVQEG